MNCVAIYSFRHTFISSIRNNHAFDLSLIQQIVGHEISKGGITDKYTHGGASLKRLNKVVMSYRFYYCVAINKLLCCACAIFKIRVEYTYLFISTVV